MKYYYHMYPSDTIHNISVAMTYTHVKKIHKHNKYTQKIYFLESYIIIK